MLKIDGHDDAVIGPAMIWGVDKKGGGIRISVLVYDAEAIRTTLMERDGMDAEEAREYIEFNIEGAYMGPDTPILVWLEDLWDEDYDE
jgi:hypothetical protein